MVRVLQLGLEWFPEQGGGLDRYYYDLCRLLPPAGIPVRGLVIGSDRVAASSGGAVRGYADSQESLPRRWRAVRNATQAVKADFPFDLVASHFALYTFPTLRLFRGKPLVVHFHGPWAEECRAEGAGKLGVFLKTRLERAVYQRAARLIVLSQAFKKLLLETYRVDESRIEVVPGGVETHRFCIASSKSEAREQLGWPTDRPIVLSIRRLVHRMGLSDLIAAVAELRKAVPDVLVLIGGKGPLASALAQQIEAAGLSDHVRLLGYVPDEQLPIAYRAADMTVVPTLSLEGFGLIVAESLAAGTPALVTPIGSLPEVVSGLSPDLVLPSTGPASIADGLAQALTGRTRLPSAEACQRFATDNFDWSVVVRKVAAIYSAAVAGSH